MGAFTVDRFAAARKLSRTQFPSPYHYALKLVQWAVASGARSVNLIVWPNSLSLEHDGEQIGERLPELVRYALTSPTGPERRLAHLASALLAVQALHPRRVYVKTRDQTLLIQGEEDRLLKSSSRRDEVRIFGLPLGPRRFPSSTGSYLTVGLSSIVRPEVELLITHCGFSEVPVYLGGMPLSRPFFLGVHQHRPRVVKGRTRLYIPPGHTLPIRVALAPAGRDAAISVPGPETAAVFPQGRFWLRSQPGSFQALGSPRRPQAAPAEAVKLTHLSLAEFPMYRGWALLLDYRGNFEHRLTAGFRSNALRLVQDGVLIESVQPVLGDRKLLAEGIVATGSLPLDLSHFRYQRGPELNELIHEVGAFLDLAR